MCPKPTKTPAVAAAWPDWVSSNCVLTYRTAQAYARLFKALPELPAGKAQRVAGLRVREAVRAIATSPNAPPKSTATSNSPTRPQDDRDRVSKTFVEGAKALRQAARRIGSCIRYLALVLYWTARQRSGSHGRWAAAHQVGVYAHA